jgi:predicted phosphohydrolase
MKIQLKSDIPNNFSFHKTRELNPSDRFLHPEADVLVLAGDISTAETTYMTEQLYVDSSSLSRPTILVPGNHEYEYGDIDTTMNDLKAKLRGTNVHILNRDYLVIDNVVFIGATLWTPLIDHREIALKDYMREFTLVKGMTTDRWANEYVKDLGFINFTLHNPLFKDMKKVVITHFLPSFQCVPERFIGNEANCFFASDCEHLMTEDWAPTYWFHGHTHDSVRKKIGNTEIICNPYGYYPYAINPEYNPSLIVEI